MKRIYFGGETGYKDSILRAMNDKGYVETNDINDQNDIIYWVYGGGPSPLTNFKLWARKHPVIILHWIGTDILTWSNTILTGSFLRRTWYKFRIFLINRKMRQNNLINLVCADWLASELRQIGMSTTGTMPISSIHENLITSTSQCTRKSIDFVSYVPFKRFDFYGGSKILEFAKKMPRCNFQIVHPDLDHISDNVIKDYPPNLSVSPKIRFEEMQQLLAASKCFLRFTQHDGLSLSVLEALLNRNAIFWTQPFPFTHHVNFAIESSDQICRRLELAIETWSHNEDGRQYVIENFASEHLSSLYKDLFLRMR